MILRRSSPLDGRADEVAPLGPRAVVVPDVLHAHQVLEDEPGVARALADAAVGDGRPVGLDAGGAVELLQVVGGLESTVLVARLAPGHARRARDVAAALAGL